MKITLLLLFSFLVISTCSAQITRGTVFVGGSGSYSRQAYESNPDPNFSYELSTSSFNFNPKVGYFIADNITVGLGVNYSRSKSEAKGTGINEPTDNKYHAFGMAPFGRYYKMLGERAGFFGQLTVSFDSGKEKSGDFTTRKNSSVGAGIAPGFVFFATPRIGIETTVGSLGYYFYKNKYYDSGQNNPTESTSNQFIAGVEASNIFLGINFYLGR